MWSRNPRPGLELQRVGSGRAWWLPLDLQRWYILREWIDG